MKRLMLTLVAFLVCFALGSGGGAYYMKPAAHADSAADSTHADAAAHDAERGGSDAHPGERTPGAGGSEFALGTAGLPDSATLADDPHIADPGRTWTPAPARMSARVTPHLATDAPTGTTARGTADATAGSTASPRTRTLGAGARTIESLVRANTGATVTLRPDGTIGPDDSATDSVPDYARLARVLGKMGPREAARALAQLNDAEAARALASMPDKQAALVLQQLAPDKAAMLLQATLALHPKVAAP